MCFVSKMDTINTESTIINNKNLELFKFFAKPTNRKTKPKSNEKLKMPLKRTTRLKSKTLIDDICRALPDGEYDITRENFGSSKISVAPIANKTNILISNTHDEMNDEVLDGDFTSEGKNVTHTCKDITISTNNTNMLKKPENSPSKTELIRQRLADQRHEISNKLMDETLKSTSVQELVAVTNATEKPKKRGRKSMVDTVNDLNNTPKRQRVSKIKKPKLTNKILLTNVPQGNITNNDLHKSSDVPVQQKKRGRKPKALKNLMSDATDKNEMKNECNVNNKQSELVLNCTAIDQALKESQLNEKTQNSLEKTTLSNNLNKKGNSEPKKKGRRKSTKPKLAYTKLSKVTKQQIKNANTRKIPKDRLEDALDIINNDDHSVWRDRNTSCNPSIHLHWDPCTALIADQNIKLKYARQFLLRRDWIGLSKVLFLTNSNAKLYYPLLSKYATLLMAHTDKEQFNKIVQFLTSVSDSSAVMAKCTQISKEYK